MTKFLALSLVTFALSACSSMGMTSGNVSSNTGETKNSTDANKSGNPAAVSPGSGAR
ncbi:MAG TPA: hypothetical protein VIL30_19400 [Ramlibacter sp.]|jgi:hypothetical protein